MFESRSLEGVNRVVSGVSNKNILVNGTFDAWQRGNSFASADSEFTADQWEVPAAVSTGPIVSKLDTLVSDMNAGVPFNSHLQIDPRGTANKQDTDNRLFQYIEGIYPGQEMTFSVWIKGSSNTTLVLEVRTISNTGDSNSKLSPPIAISGVWKRYEVSFIMPDIPVGANVGTSYSLIMLRFEQSNTLTFSIGGAQLELGHTATQFENLSPGDNLARCQRYYWRGKLMDSHGFRSLSAISTSALAGSFSFPVPMFKNPTMQILTQPTYIACSTASITANETDNCFLKVTNDGSSNYRAFDGLYEAVASII